MAYFVLIGVVWRGWVISFVNMNYLEIEPAIIHLQGISRSCSFRITNRNDFLAVAYSIEASDPSTNILKVFPQQGFLLAGQQQKIRVKVASEQNSTEQSVEVSYSLRVKFSYNAQYNKRCLIKNNMAGWDQLPKEVFEKQVRIVSGGERQAIEHYIKEQIDFEKKFGTDELDLSAIKQKQGKEGENQSILDLDISSKLTDNKQDNLGNKPTRPQLNQSLEVDRIIPLDIGESRTKQDAFRRKQRSKKESVSGQLLQSKLIPQELGKSFQLSLKSAKGHSFSQDGTFLNNSAQANSKQKTLDLIILAVIAAFFVALGSNIKRLIS